MILRLYSPKARIKTKERIIKRDSVGLGNMTDSLFKFILMLLVVGILVVDVENQAVAQNTDEYHCQPENQIIHAESLDTHILVCSIRAPVDEKKLRFLAEQAYRGINNRNYKSFAIWWLLLSGNKDEISSLPIGITFFEDGILTLVEIPLVKKK